MCIWKMLVFYACNSQCFHRRVEKRNPCCAWECSDTDSGITDNAFHQYREAKQKVRHKCSYLDEKNFILSPHLFAQPRSCVSAANDASYGANSRWKASQITRVPAKSANLDVNITSERSSAPDLSCVPINPSDSKTQRQNIISENSMQVHIVEVSRILPMIEWIPETSHEQMTVETKAWRCTGFVTANHETRSPEAFWKEASRQKLEWSQERLAKAAHLGSSLPAKGLPAAARHRVVIQRVARIRGYRGTRMQGSHGERKLEPLPNHKDLHNIYSLSALQNQYECLCSPFQPWLKHSPVGDQRDAAQNIDRKQEGQRSEFSDAIGDIRCQSRCRKNAESPPTPHHVTFSHILQVLQSKPGNFSEFRGQRCHRAL
ncbi:hypothetical protein ABG768_017159 [Culter alburnus]|uniref:Uncharacterized protein n=1 Tax=Culter alburnus TaxID=194366 RepID=A0AAW1YYX4_CULAL